MTHPTDDELDALVARLHGTPLYEGHGEASETPERAADAITAIRTQLAEVMAQNERLWVANERLVKQLDEAEYEGSIPFTRSKGNQHKPLFLLAKIAIRQVLGITLAPEQMDNCGQFGTESDDESRRKSRSRSRAVLCGGARIKTRSRNAPAKTKAPRFPEGLMFANRGFVNINRS